MPPASNGNTVCFSAPHITMPYAPRQDKNRGKQNNLPNVRETARLQLTTKCVAKDDLLHSDIPPFVSQKAAFHAGNALALNITSIFS